jgi:lipopolysaccharide export system permease protein
MLIGWTFGSYVGMNFLRAIMGVFLTVFGLIYVLDFVELMRGAGDLIDVTSGQIAVLSLYRTPAIAEQVLPFAVLFGAMSALLQLSRKLELVVARAAGVSAWQFLQPGILVACLIGIFSVAVFNPVSAILKQKGTELEASIFSKNPTASSGRDTWIRQRSPEGTAIIRAYMQARKPIAKYSLTDDGSKMRLFGA